MAELEAATHISPKYTVTVTEPPKFDLQTYIQNYSGRTVFRRLFLIASCSTALAEDAARLAVAAAKAGKDIANYEDAVKLLAQVTAKDTKDLVDSVWLANQEKKNAAETKRLENELKQYKNNLIRESIRMGSEELGVHYHDIGDLGNALKSFNRMKEYTTVPAHIATTGFRTIAVNIEQKNWLSVQSQVARIRSLTFKAEETARHNARAAAANGLQYMSLGDFKEAANAFLSVEFTLGDSYNEVISSNDVAVYGGLCALADMSRAELQSRVLESTNFRSFLELEPHIRRAINYFCASKYSQCLEILESYRADYLLDIYLQDQVPNLYKKIRTKAIVQYFQPFSRVKLDSMEEMFGRTFTDSQAANAASSAFREELLTMIKSGALEARIDLENNVLIAYEESPRAVMQQKALDAVDNFIREAQIKLLRLNAVNGGLAVKPEVKTQGQTKTGSMSIEGLVDQGAHSNFKGNGYSLRSRD